MARMGYGYGSECHLLRFMGRHRHLLDQRILAVVGGDRINWLDFEFEPRNPWPDKEIKGLGFLAKDHPARLAWEEQGPHGRGIHNWDAVAKVGFGEAEEWLLVEANANLGEIASDCRAKSPTSLAKIKAVFAETKQALGVSEEQDWLKGCYQYCNRLAAVHFLNARSVPAHLLNIHFVGDRSGPRRKCPQDEAEWGEPLAEQDRLVGLPASHVLTGRIHRMFLPVVL